jgi:hypothetical protein
MSENAMSENAMSDSAMSGSAMSEPERRQIAETLFERTPEEVRDAIKLEEERRAVLVKNLYRLRALRLSRDRNRIRTEEGPTVRR